MRALKELIIFRIEEVFMFKKIKDAINKFLEDLAKENKELYGSGRLDCCNLNKTKGKSSRK